MSSAAGTPEAAFCPMIISFMLRLFGVSPVKMALLTANYNAGSATATTRGSWPQDLMKVNKSAERIVVVASFFKG
jgi:hypothetical protein